MPFSDKYFDYKTLTFYLALSRFLGYKQQSKLRILQAISIAKTLSLNTFCDASRFAGS